MPPFAGQGMCAGLRDVNNLAWKLDLVLRGQADEGLLDTYGPERTPHVRHFAEMSMQLGRVICVPDVESAARRDQEMIAAIQDPTLAPPDAQPPRLGAGALAVDDNAAGLLSIQSRVAYDGREGLFDDLVGHGWFVLTRAALGPLSTHAQATLVRLGGRVLTIGATGNTDTHVDVVDLDGRYVAWFSELQAEAIVVRPDFYVYAALSCVDAVEDTLVALGRQIPPLALVTA